VPQNVESGISGTAFMVNCSRSKRVEVSKDIYACLWVTPESLALWDVLAADVYPNDDVNLSVRNRFFLEKIQDFIDDNQDPVFVDIAAGFDNYPFLLRGECAFLEFDLPHVMAYKKEMVDRWMAEGKLPRRSVEYLSTDLNDQGERNDLRRTLRRKISGRSSIVTLQGITYYMRRRALDELFAILRDVQNAGSMIAFDFWRPDAMHSATMVRFEEYLGRTYGYENLEWNLFDEGYLDGLEGFTRVETTDIAGLERRYSQTRLLQGEDKIPGCYAVLRRED
jgi:O-methyltransferase involved in polyketide biosynthesis